MSRNLPTIVPEKHIKANATQRSFLGAGAEQARDMHRLTLWFVRSAIGDIDRIVNANRDKYDSMAEFVRHATEELIWAWQEVENAGQTTIYGELRRERAETIERMRIENDFATFVATFEVRLNAYLHKGIWNGILSVLEELAGHISRADEYWQVEERKIGRAHV